MNHFATPSHIRSVGEKYGIYAKKSFGQNFLVDANVLEKIVAGAEIGKEDGVIEIGPGLGALTFELAQAAGKVLAVEIDKKLIPVLEDMFCDRDNVRIVSGDILKIDIEELIKTEFAGFESVKVVANLPYYITTPIIMKFLEEKINIKQMVVMVQKEVADRMCASPGTKDYGALTLAVSYYTDPAVVTKVLPHCFMPQPKVTSTVISLKVLEKPKVDIKSEKTFFALVGAAFGQRRKTLANAICNSNLFEKSKNEVYTILEGLGINREIRGEKLSLIQFAQISNALANENCSR